MTEEFNEYCIQGTEEHGGVSVLVWGCICSNEKCMLVQVKDKMDRFQYINTRKCNDHNNLDNKMFELYLHAW